MACRARISAPPACATNSSTRPIRAGRCPAAPTPRSISSRRRNGSSRWAARRSKSVLRPIVSGPFRTETATDAPCSNRVISHKRLVEMSIESSTVLAEPRPSFRELFTPKLITILTEGYGLAALRADIVAGLTVAIVALPLSMAIAIASNTTPERGLYTAIVGGFLVSALGGSRFQIGGPAGAFIVLVAAAVDRHGIDGVLLAVAMAGMFLAVAGFLRLGTYIKFIPYAVTVGFTCGIAVTIVASQIKDLGGLTLPGAEPGPLFPKLAALSQALPTINPAAFAVGAG